MLFEFEGNLVDIVKERPYKGIYTVRAASGRALRKFRKSSGGEMIKVPHHLFPFVIHIGEYSLPYKIPLAVQSDIEVVDRLTPEPACFLYEYAYEEDGRLHGDYGYCWPDEIEETRDRLIYTEKPIEGDPIFVPIFRIPGELIGAPFRLPEGEIEFKTWDEIDENKPDNE